MSYKKGLRTTKRYSEAVNRRTDNTIVKRKRTRRTKGPTMVDYTLHRKLKENGAPWIINSCYTIGTRRVTRVK